MNEDTVKSILLAKQLGAQQYEAFVSDRIVNCKLPVTDTLPRNSLVLFHTQLNKKCSKSLFKTIQMKKDCQLFARLFIACQSTGLKVILFCSKTILFCCHCYAKKLDQFLGIVVFLSTRLLDSSPRATRTYSFKLLQNYWSHTMSSLSTSASCDLRNGIKLLSTYSPNVLGLQWQLHQ